MLYDIINCQLLKMTENNVFVLNCTSANMRTPSLNNLNQIFNYFQPLIVANEIHLIWNNILGNQLLSAPWEDLFDIMIKNYGQRFRFIGILFPFKILFHACQTNLKIR